MNNSLRKIQLIGGAFISLLFLGVKCERPESIGPSYVIAPDGFTVSSFSANTATGNVALNTAGATLSFNAAFNENVSWTMKLKGLRSGATKQISGTSSFIDASNAAWKWNGAHDGQYFFMKNEKVEITLTFLGSDIVAKDTITLTQTKQWKNFLLGDFESGAPLAGQYPTWVASAATGAFDDGDPGAGGAYMDTNTLDPLDALRKFRPIQGFRAYNLFGPDLNNSYFVSGIRRGITIPNRNGFPLSADSLYLNIYIYGLGDKTSRLNFGAQEDDADIDGTTGIGTHAPTGDDEYQTQITLDHIGWKLFSFKYSDLATAADPLNGGNGNKKHEPRQITGITFGLISSPPKNNVRVIFDFPILSYGGPFDPNK